MSSDWGKFLAAHTNNMLRIVLKWGTAYGEVGQHRGEVTLVTAMISEVPHLGQGSCCWGAPATAVVSILSFLPSVFRRMEFRGGLGQYRRHFRADSDGSGDCQ